MVIFDLFQWFEQKVYFHQIKTFRQDFPLFKLVVKK